MKSLFSLIMLFSVHSVFVTFYLIFRNSGKIDLDVFPKDKYSAFYKNRSLHFFNITLEDIAEDLERLFCTKIVILNEDLAKKKYFACFGNNESLDEILNAINADKKINIRKKEGVIYLK